jgi:malate dehydrogenase
MLLVTALVGGASLVFLLVVALNAFQSIRMDALMRTMRTIALAALGAVLTGSVLVLLIAFLRWSGLVAQTRQDDARLVASKERARIALSRLSQAEPHVVDAAPARQIEEPKTPPHGEDAARSPRGRAICVIGGDLLATTLMHGLAGRRYDHVTLLDPARRQLGATAGVPLLASKAETGRPAEGVGGEQVLWSDTASPLIDASIVVLTAGATPPSETPHNRLVRANSALVGELAVRVAQLAPQATLIVATPPADAMAQLACAVGGFPSGRVMGLANVLETAYLRALIAEEVGVSASDVEACVIGRQGKGLAPLLQHATVASIPVAQLISPERLTLIDREARQKALRGFNGPYAHGAHLMQARALLALIDAVALDQRRIIPCAVYLDGQYGVRGAFVGVPAELGARGVERIIEAPITDAQLTAMRQAANAVKGLRRAMGC